MKTAVIVPGDAPQWVENHVRHVAQRMASRGRVLVAFTHTSTVAVSLPGRTEQSSLLGHSVSGYPLWTGRVSAVVGFRWRTQDTVLVLWQRANLLMAVTAAVMSKIKRERLTVVHAERPQNVSIVAQGCHRLLAALAHDVVGLPASTSRGESPRMVLALCGSNAAFIDAVVRSLDAMSDEVATGWQFVLHVDDADAVPELARSGRERCVSVLTGPVTRPLLRQAEILIAPHDSPQKRIVSDAVLFGGTGVVVGGPVAGRVLRQPDGVWLAREDCAALIVAFEASAGGLLERPHSIEEMRSLAEDVVALLTPLQVDDPA